MRKGYLDRNGKFVETKMNLMNNLGETVVVLTRAEHLEVESLSKNIIAAIDTGDLKSVKIYADALIKRVCFNG